MAQLLVLSSAHGAGPVLPSLELLSHRVRQIPAEPAQLVNAPSADVIFVDARNDEHYHEGHIPGALHFDRFRPADHLPQVMPAAQMAEKVIVYCGGGDCEDSKFGALQLLEQGIPPYKVYVYMGGVKEWTARGLPLEQGERGSGAMIQGGAK